MKWYIYPDINNKVIQNFFDFNRIDYTTVELKKHNRDSGVKHDLTTDILGSTNSGLILSGESFESLLNWPQSQKHLIDFINHNNYVWVCSDIDGFNNTNINKISLINLDTQITKNKLYLSIDAQPSDRHWIYQLKNINVRHMKYNWFMTMPRIFNSYIDKTCAQKDFLLTAIKKNSRPYRNILWQELNARQGLTNKGYAIFRANNDVYIGHEKKDTMWKWGVPSMDLYCNSWLEIIPETHYKGSYFFTEKTTKPIGTKTPFLVVSTCGYLEYLKSLGFQTFGSLINENYDSQYKIRDRVKLMLDQLEDIIKNGSESFYHASQSILDHNYNRLAEISGDWQNSTDKFIQQTLDEIDR